MKKENIFVVAWDELIGPDLTDVDPHTVVAYGYFKNEYECKLLCDQLSQRSNEGIVYYPYSLAYRLDIFTHSKFVPMCWKCTYGIKQLDLFDNRITHIEGCRVMDPEDWDNMERRVTKCDCAPKGDK